MLKSFFFITVLVINPAIIFAKNLSTYTDLSTQKKRVGKKLQEQINSSARNYVKAENESVQVLKSKQNVIEHFNVFAKRVGKA